MNVFKISFIYQILYILVFLGCIHSGVLTLFVSSARVEITFHPTIFFFLCIILYIINIIHFRKLQLPIRWMPVIFTPMDEREQKIINEVSSTGFRIFFPVSIIIGACLIFEYIVFKSFTGNIQTESLIYILWDVILIICTLPYMLYTMSVYRKIKKV